jgi:hypothetical protein
MKPIFRKLLIVAGIILLIPSLLGIAGYMYRDQVRDMMVAEINEHLATEISVDNISFSLLSSFPFAELRFSKVVVKEPAHFSSSGTVLSAEKVSLLMGIGSIFSRPYQLRKIIIENASLNLQVDAKGNPNYEVWKSTKEADEGGVAFDLQDLVFKNVDVLYYNVLKNQDISFLITDGNLSGNFRDQNYLLNSRGELTAASVKLDGTTYLSKKDCSIDLGISVDGKIGSYTFSKSTLKLAGLELQIQGVVKDTEDGLDTDLTISSPGADLISLLSLIPEKYIAATKEYNYSGNMDFSGSVKGLSGKKSTPHVEFSFRCSDVSLNPKGTSYHLTKVNTAGYFTNRKNKANPVTYLKLENFKAVLEGKPVRAEIEIENFSRPMLNITASAEMALEPLSKFFLPQPLVSLSGNMTVDASFNGIAGEKSTYRSSGNIRFDNVAFKVKDQSMAFTGFSALIHLRGNDVVVEDFSGKAGRSDFSMSGDFRNLFGWLLDQKQKLDISAIASAGLLDLNELLADDQKHSNDNDSLFRLNFSDRLKCKLDLEADRLLFRKFEASNISGQLALESKVLMTRQLNFNTSGGSVRLKGTIDDRPADSLRIEYDALINGLDINRLFFEMGNFGQQVIVDKNLKGRVSAEIQFRSMWTDRLDINDKSIYVKSDIVIENGELLNFDPMLALSKFVKGTDLRAIRFSTLSNTIEIKNRKIHIPMMEIKSSAIDIAASGVHTFDNAVDYKLQLYLSQILGRKVKEQNTEFGVIEDDGLGRPRLFVTMKGTASDPKFAWDRKATEKKITDEISKETKGLKQLLKEEFGRKEPDQPAKETKKPKREELQIDFDDDGE